MKFPKSKLTPEVWNYIGSRWQNNLINYVTNSKYRKAVNLKSWLKEQIIPAENELTECDDAMMKILRTTRVNLKYEPDSKIWKMPEYWQTFTETNELKTGDCEDGAILMYVKARQAGIPANRLMIMCGDVENPSNNIQTVGHCWLAYKGDSYPLHWCFLDWCYYYNANNIEERPKYWIEGKVIGNKYKTLWFAFNELGSHSELKYKAGDFNE